MIAAVIAFVTAPTASAYVSNTISGTYYKDYDESNERIAIHYNRSSPRATAIYEIWECDEAIVYYNLSGSVSSGYLVLSGKGKSYGKRKSMKVRITQVNDDTIKVVTGNGRTYYFYRHDWSSKSNVINNI